MIIKSDNYNVKSSRRKHQTYKNSPSTEDTALCVAIRNNEIKTVKRLSRNNSQIIHEHRGGYTVLRLAVIYEKLEIVKILLKRNADVNIQTACLKYIPLHLAAFYNLEEILSCLLEQEKANPALQDTYGNTFIHLACKRIIESLSKEYEDIYHDIKNNAEKTPLDITRDLDHKEFRS